MRNNIYKLAWVGVPIVFIIFYALKGQTCLMGSCTGDNNQGMVYGIGAVIVYALVVKGIAHEKNKFWDLNGIKSGFFLFLIVLVILLVYFLGKTN